MVGPSFKPERARRDKMSRNRILAAGVVLWTVAIADGAAHLVSGDMIAPALMAVVAVGGAALIAVRARRTRQEA
jgi:hypothetical protein